MEQSMAFPLYRVFVLYMNNFCSTLYFFSEQSVSQHCELYLFVLQRPLFLPHMQHFEMSQQISGYQMTVQWPAVNSPGGNKFITIQSKDMLDCLNFYNSGEFFYYVLKVSIYQVYCEGSKC
jgi:hypothetical protein